MFDIKEIYRAPDVKAALHRLSQEPDAVVICGGTDVLIKIREGKLAGRCLVSIHDIPALHAIELEEDGTLRIGAAATFSEINAHPLIQKLVPMLAQAVDTIGGPQIRNMGTVGGNLCNGATSADSAPTLLTLDASLELESAAGMRRVALRDFYTGPGQTVRRSDEILTAVRIARDSYEGGNGCYIKYGKREAMEISTLGCAVHVRLSPDKSQVESLRLAFGVAAPIPMRCPETEKAAAGQAVGEALYRLVSENALKEVRPRTSWRASEAFRRQLVKELSVRALKQAIAGAGGESHA